MLPSSSKKTASKKLENLRFVGSSKFMKELQKTVFLKPTILSYFPPEGA
jgi:hypothetical protein